MEKHHANLVEARLPVTPGHKNLYAYGKAHGKGGEHKIIQAGHHGGAKLQSAHMP